MGYHELARRMRDRITGGGWPAPGRLPTKLQLCDEYGSSNTTVQRALNLLTAEGFLCSRGRAGTWVTANPPHLTHVGIVLPGTRHQSAYWRQIVSEAQRLHADGPLRFSVYEKCMYPVGPDQVRLREDLAARRLAGIVTRVPVDQIMDRALADGCGVVRLGLGLRDPYPGGICLVSPRPTPLILRYLQRKGYRRLALIATFSQYGPGTGQSDDIAREAAAHGISAPPHLIHPVSVRDRWTAISLMQLMMALPATSRPDAVYVMDDHLVAVVTKGLLNAKVAVGPNSGLEVVAHANFPMVPKTHVPVTFCGQDIRTLMTRAAQLLTDRIGGKAVPAQVTMPPVFAFDLPYKLD